MDKIVGNYAIFCIAIFFGFSLSAQSMLRIVDRKGMPIKEATAQVPFKLELIIENADRSYQAPQIPGLAALRIEGTETRMNIVNGKTTLIYGYHVRADKPGSYKVGPLDDPLFGKVQSLAIKVGKEPPAQGKADNSQQPFARLTIDKKNCVVGEKIHCSLRFYYQDEKLSLENVHEPEVSDMKFANRIGPIAGKETVNKHFYNYIEWEWDGCPTKAGSLTIPAYCLDFNAAAQPDGQPDIFSLFFRQRRERKRLYSNDLAFNVDVLPACAQEVHAIGSFTSCSLRTKPAIAQEGEGIVLTVELVGDGNLEKLELFPLNDMPEALKWYDSKNYCEDFHGKNIKKCFEYIIQGLQPGDWEIPAQKFTYFDVKKRSYKTLETQPKIITITSAHKDASFVVPHHESPQAAIATSIETNSEIHNDALCALDGAGSLHAYRERSIAWWMFGFLLTIPLGILCARKFVLRKNRNITGGDKKKNFAKAHTALILAEKNEAFAQVYPIFIDLFMIVFELPETGLIEEIVEQKMAQHNVAPEQKESWRRFFLAASEYAFFPANIAHEHQYDFFKEAHSWLTVFEGLL